MSAGSVWPFKIQINQLNVGKEVRTSKLCFFIEMNPNTFNNNKTETSNSHTVQAERNIFLINHLIK